MKKLTVKEEQLMKYLWRLKNAYMKDLVDKYPKPKPAYTTIATLITRLIDKNYIGYEQQGKVRMYFPLVKQNQVYKSRLKNIVKDFFNNSDSQFVSYFTSNANLSTDELKELKRIIQERIESKKKRKK